LNSKGVQNAEKAPVREGAQKKKKNAAHG